MKTVQSLAELILVPLGLENDVLQVEVVKQRILAYRQTLIQQDFNRYLRISESVVQAFNIQLKEVVEDEDKFYISDILPKPMILRKNDPFLSVHTALHGRTKQPIAFLPVEEIPYMQYRKFTSKGFYYTYEQDRIKSFTPATAIRVRAIWDDPIAVFEFAEKETFKLSCSTDTITSPCVIDGDLVLEETLAAKILTFFNTNGINPTSESSRDRSD